MSKLVLGKYGQMAKQYLKESHSERYRELQSNGELADVLHKLEEEIFDRKTLMVNQMLEKNPPPNPRDTYESYRHKLMIENIVEEIILNEMVYVPR